MELEFKHLAPYLPYGLKFSLNTGDNSKIIEVRGLTESTLYGSDGEVLCWRKIEPFNRCLFPVLRPLNQVEDIIEEFDALEVYSANYVNGVKYDTCQFLGVKSGTLNDFNKLFEMQFDVFGLIHHGLAVSL